MTSCKQFDTQIVDWLYDELDAPAKDAFRQHVESCQACAREVASLSRIRELIRTLPAVEPPIAVSNIVMHEATKQAPSDSRGILAWLGERLRFAWAHPAVAAMASMVLIVAVGGTLYLRGRDQLAEPVVEDRPAHEMPRATPERATASVEPEEAGSERGLEADLIGQEVADELRELEAAGKAEEFKALAKKGRSRGGDARDPRDDIDTAIADGLHGEPGKSKAPRRDNKPVATASSTSKKLDATLDMNLDGDGDTSADKGATRTRATGGTRAALDDAAGAGQLGAAEQVMIATDDESQYAPPPPVASAPARPEAAQRSESDIGRSAPGKESAASQWLDQQRARLERALKSGRCTEVASIANDILDKDPVYYQRNVASAAGKCKRAVLAETKRRAQARRSKRSVPPSQATQKAQADQAAEE